MKVNMVVRIRNLFLTDKKKSYTTLLKLSSKHFKKALKKEKSTINQLNIIYNLKLKGSSKKANKNLEKLKLDKANLSEIENEIIQNIITNSIVMKKLLLLLLSYSHL